MSRNPVANYNSRSGFRMGQVEFKDFLWEALLDPAANVTMGGTAENLARRYQITREEVDRYAERSFARAMKAQEAGYFAEEIIAVVDEVFEIAGLNPRGIKLPKGASADKDTHIRASTYEALAKIRPAFGGVQTGGNSSAVVDGAAAVVLSSHSAGALSHIRAYASVGVAPEIMGIGPVPAIQALLAKTGLSLKDIDLVEINEAFGAQAIACSRALGLDEEKFNVNGGAIAIGHPLGATGVRLALTISKELQRRKGRYGIASACIGGGQGIAMLIERA
jgi:acetyl-CoA C-acetyltransferase